MPDGPALFPSDPRRRPPDEGREPPDHAGYALVALERGIDRPGGLTYAIPRALAGLAPGDRVDAPLGRGDRLAPGYVIEVRPAAAAALGVDPLRIKPIARRVGPTLPATVLDLARWMSRYYVCPLGMVLSAVLPAAVKRAAGVASRARLIRSGAEPAIRLPPKTADAWRAVSALPDDAFPADPRSLAVRVGLPSTALLTRLASLGLLRTVRVPMVRAASIVQDADFEHERARAPRALTARQDAAVNEIDASAGRFAGFLLFGVTGSGKTEVYLAAIRRALDRGQAAIVLVPEISLTPQTAARFVARFGGEAVAILHSGLTATQRHQQWRHISDGDARVIVGARSAVFAPVPPPGVGLIVVDEEHDGSYKQDQLPRYHARNVALKRGQLEGCPVVLGSATPSLESWHNARDGRLRRLDLPDRVGGGAMPRVRIVDLTEERRAEPDRGVAMHALGPTLRSALTATLRDGGQAILLLNRRGYASYVCCPDQACGWICECRSCDATLVHHRQRVAGVDTRTVRCHHCTAEQRLPERCPVCDRRTTLLGFGTQRVEEELARLLPDLADAGAIARLDSDAVRSARDLHAVLGRFGRGEVRLLLGTQMIAKGLDFPDVRLIGVVNADTALTLPDFRAAERTFQLVAQVAGRAGRSASSAGARVIVQTVNPAEPAIVHAAEHDYPAFADEELALREDAGLPPSTRMARLVCRDRDHEAATRRAARLAEALSGLGDPRLVLRGPAPCPISRIGDHHRVAIEVLSPSAPAIQAALTTLRNRGEAHADAKTAIDVDPIALL